MKHVTTKQLGITISSFGVAVLITIMILCLFSVRTEQQSQEAALKTYVIIQNYTVDSFTIWKMSEDLVAINKTQIDYLGFFELSYNQTSREIKNVQIDAWVLNETTKLVFGYGDASYVLNWAISHVDEVGGKIKILSGNYVLDSTIWLRGSDIAFIGEGAWFQPSGNFTYPMFSVYGTNVAISGLNINATERVGN